MLQSDQGAAITIDVFAHGTFWMWYFLILMLLIKYSFDGMKL